MSGSDNTSFDRMISAGHISGVGSSGDNAEIHAPTVNVVYSIGKELALGGTPATPNSHEAEASVAQRVVLTNLGARNAGFVGRQAALTAISDILSDRGRVVTRSRDRMGGIGKTQLAIEFAYQNIENYDIVWLIPSETEQLIGGHLAQLSMTAGLSDPSATTPAAVADLHQLVANRGRILLIFDNAEEPDSLTRWLPPRGGHVIITSRHPGWDEIATPVEISVFARDESKSLLKSRVPQLPDVDADKLAEALGDLPLAIAQASSVMAETGMSASDYLDLLADHAAEILAAGPPPTYKTSLAATVKLSLERLRNSHPAAEQLLRLCSVLAPEPIPLEIFTISMGLLPEPLSSAGRNKIAFFDVVRAAGEHGLVGISHAGIQLHRLIQAIVKDDSGLSALAAAREVMSRAVAAAAPRDVDAPEAWTTWSSLAAHIIALKPEDTEHDELQETACNLALYLLRRGEWRPALELTRVMFFAWRERLGVDNIRTLRAATEYAHALYVSGDFSAARDLIVETLARYKDTLGDDHPDTLRSANDLAVVLHNFGDFAADYALSVDTLARSRRVLGEDHPDAIQAALSLSATLHALGRYREAESVKRKALEGARRVLGDNHPSTLRAAWSLSQTLYVLDEFEEDRELSEKTFARSIRVLGADHPETLRAASGFAMTLSATGDYDRAAALQEDTLARCRALYAENHVDIIGAVFNLGAIRHAQDRLEEALKLKQEAFAAYRRVYGETHMEVVSVQLSIGNTLHNMRRIPEALSAKVQALSRYRQKLGDDHPRTLEAAHSLAMTYCVAGQLLRARALIDEVCQRKVAVLGFKSPSTKKAFADRRWIAGALGGRIAPRQTRGDGKKKH
ncbi:FxSxx-COOH system tetratricopeptide repeat protein [Micromonospora chalcea]|uniref:FxSxx-COOH system tetratricopeptide repeat protein n=1 Tax=Micromonospora chalcea TaxID=1874 RepID=UPI0033CDDA71